MGQVTVDGLGVVEIRGDWPTAEEDLKIQALLAKRTAEPTPTAAPAQAATPEQMEELGLGGLAETLGGFQQMEDPREGRGALTQGAAALGAGASRVARGALLETGLAAAEALLGREEVEQSPSFALHKEWKAMEEGLYKPSVSFDDVLDDPSLANITSFIAESGVESVPAMATALWSMPRLALSMVGGIAQQRADNRGPGSEVTGGDLAWAAGASGIVAVSSRLGAKLSAGGGSGATPLRRVGQAVGGELLTEAAEEGVQTIGEQAFTREGEGFVAGVDPTEMAKRMAAGALVGGPMGGVMSTGVEGGRAIRRATRPPSRRREAPPTVIVEPEATPTEAVVAPTPSADPWLEVGFEPSGQLYDPRADQDRFRAALDSDGDVGERIDAIEAIFRKPGAERTWLSMRNNALGRMEGDPRNPVLRYAALRSEYLAEHRDGKEGDPPSRLAQGLASALVRLRARIEPEATPTEAVVAEEAVTPTEAVVEEEIVAEPTSGSDTKEQAAKAAGLVKGRGRWYPANADGTTDTSQAVVHPVNIDGDWHMITSTGMGGGLGTVFHEYKPGLVDPLREGVPFEYSKKDLERRITDAKTTPTEAVVEGVVEETGVPKDTVPGEFDQIAPMPLPMEAGPEVPAVDIVRETTTIVEDIESLRAQVKAIRSEERKAKEAVATRPGTKPVERKKGRELNKAEQKLHELESVEAALDPVRPVVDVLDAAVESEAAGTRALAGTQDVMRAANEDVVAFLESMGRTPEQISSIMRRKAAGYAETLQRMRAEGLETTVDGAGNIHMSEKMSELVDILLERPYQVSGIEQTALLSGLVQSQKAWRDTMQRIGELDAKEAANPVERNAIDGEIRKLDAKRREISEIGDKIGAANAVAGTRTSEAFKARNWGVDSEMTLFQARAKARGLKGSKLDSTQAEFIDKEFAEADKLIAEATKAKAEADKKLKDANRKLLAATKDLKRAQGIKEATARVAKKTKPKEARKKARKKAAEDLAAEAEGKPIRVTPIKPSAREKAARKAFKEAQKKAKAALGEVADAQGKRVKADGTTRDARTRKRKAPEEALKPWLVRQWADVRDKARAMTASGDTSAFGRQGAMMVLESPVVAVKTFRHALGVAPWKGDAARAYAEKEQRKILSEPMQQVRDWAGLEMTEVEGLTNVKGGPMQAREETFVTDVFKSGWLRPLNEWLIRPSQNSFGLMLNEMRKANFDEGMKILAERRGAAPDATPEQIMKLVPKEDARALGGVINASTGRGSWLLTSPAIGRGAGVINVADMLVKNMLFAPKHSVSRVETMSHFFSMLAGTGRFKNVSRGDEGALNVFRKRAAKVFTLWASIGLMSVLAAGEFEDEELSEEEKSRRKKQAADNFLNPGHADFMKGRLGKHHFDVFGGVPSTVRLLVPFAIAPIEGKYELEPRLASKFGRLVRNKLNPLISAASKAAYNEDYLGRELVSDEEGWIAHALHRVILPGVGAFTPITVQNVAEQVARDANDEDIDAMDAAASQFLEAIGVGDPVYTEGWKSPEMRARSRRSKKRPKGRTPPRHNPPTRR